MGSDNIFHKRKAKKASSLRREKARREPYEVVLIACEGEKTEPRYFNGLRKQYRLNNANIVICGKECGSSPINVVDCAIRRANEENIFDRVYCVFDKDQHEAYKKAIDKIKNVSLPRDAKIYVITSVPCFEFWLLLHFRYTTRYYTPYRTGSICDSVMKDLEEHIENYRDKKGKIDAIKETFHLIDDAIKNAKGVQRYHQTSGTDNPSTKVHELVEYMRKLNTLKR